MPRCLAFLFRRRISLAIFLKYLVLHLSNAVFSWIKKCEVKYIRVANRNPIYLAQTGVYGRGHSAILAISDYSEILASQFLRHLSQSVLCVAAFTAAAWLAFRVAPKGIVA